MPKFTSTGTLSCETKATHHNHYNARVPQHAIKTLPTVLSCLIGDPRNRLPQHCTTYLPHSSTSVTLPEHTTIPPPHSTSQLHHPNNTNLMHHSVYKIYATPYQHKISASHWSTTQHNAKMHENWTYKTSMTQKCTTTPTPQSCCTVYCWLQYSSERV